MSLAESKTTDATQTILEILQGAASQLWTLRVPEVHYYEGVTQSAKTSKEEPALYCWSPSAADIERFSADRDHKLETHTVEIHVWTLDKEWTQVYSRDIITILEMYESDNKNLTNWVDIRPESSDDVRSENITRKSGHFLYTIEAELETLNLTKATNRTLRVPDGETYTIPDGVEQKWAQIDVAGDLVINGTLTLTGPLEWDLKDLEIEAGERYTVPAGVVEHWNSTEVEGELVVEGEIILEA